MNANASPDSPARYLIGIDLGTTNSAVAYVDTAAGKVDADWAVRDFPVPQLVAPSLVEARPTLPSFHYEPAAGEFSDEALQLPWDATTTTDKSASKPSPSTAAVGTFACDHGANVPGRLIASAKSWLSHTGVDRTAGLLPWHGAPDVERLSPVDVSARYLRHLRAAWDHAHPDRPLAAQDVVLTVPASFDEVARELTVQAAKLAGFGAMTLVEEPQAAFYAWIASQGDDWERRVQAGQTILICDVGGGTSDFTLLRVRPAADGKVLFHRVAVGEHLILGGDNLDLALAHHVERRLATDGKLGEGKTKLDPRQWGTLVRAARVAKETLLGPDAPERTTVTIAGGGSKLIGGSLRAELTRDDIERVLVDGFLPTVPIDEKPAARRSGFQEFGLPFAADAGITRYLAAFLSAHRHDDADEFIGNESRGWHGLAYSPARGNADRSEGAEHGQRSTAAHATPVAIPDAIHHATLSAARPDLVLFNGGLFESPRLRERLLDVMRSWFSSQASPWEPIVLENRRLDLAVARGAAYYGKVRRGKGVRIRGGLAHAYYLGVESAGDANAGSANATAANAAAICLMPAGVEEGQTVDLPGRQFDLLIRQPAEFPLYYSGTRTTDRPGDLVAVDAQQLTALPPIRTVLASGRSTGPATAAVTLHAKLTEIGTLEIWCAEVNGQRTWRLQFDVRSASQAGALRHDAAAEREGVVDETVVAACQMSIEGTFEKDGLRPASLIKQLEQFTEWSRWDWPASLLRSFWETLIEFEPARRLSAEHEARWLSLAGFSLRPGYGLAVDDWRVGQTWKLFASGLAFPKNEQNRAEWWVLWRRIAGGLTAGQQATLADPLLADWRMFLRKQGAGVKGRSPTFQFGPHESAEVWRLLGSLELLKPAVKLELADMLFDRLPREKNAQTRDAILFAIGRVGARVPVYGPLDAMVDPATAEAWLRRLVQLNPADAKATFAVVQLARRTGDRWRDVGDAVRAETVHWMQGRSADGHQIELVETGGALDTADQQNVLGDSLPKGLRLE